MASGFRSVLSFFDAIGLFDVVLPFLLVFAIVFAILEKTKVLGTDEIGGKQYPKKSLNGIVAFSISFLVIASAELVELLTTVSSQVVVLLFLSVLFLLLVGSFYREGESVFLEGGWKTLFMILMFIGIVGIFLNAIKTPTGESWLDRIGNYFTGANDQLIGSIALLAVMVGAIAFMLAEPKKEQSKHS